MKKYITIILVAVILAVIGLSIYNNMRDEKIDNIVSLVQENPEYYDYIKKEMKITFDKDIDLTTKEGVKSVLKDKDFHNNLDYIYIKKNTINPKFF